MPFSSLDQLRISLDYMSSELHSGLTYFLALLRKKAVESDDPDRSVDYGSADEKALLVEYMSPAGGPSDVPYYMPFGPHMGKSRWRGPKYPGSALQKQRSERADVYFQNPKDSGRWEFRPGYVQRISDNSETYVGRIPIRVCFLACFFYRQRSIDSVQAAVEKFVVEFRLRENDLLGRLFTVEIPVDFERMPLGDEPVPDAEVLKLLDVDVRRAAKVVPATEDEEGTADKVELTEEKVAPAEWKIDVDRLYETLGLAGLREPAVRAIAALMSGRHVIFTGPPGTGKTTLAEGICRAAGFPPHTVPATDQWTTFETVGGYFPVPEADGRGDRLDFLPGAIIKSIEEGRCLVVDEINRADIDKAFGELFTLFAGKPGSTVTLPYRRRDAAGHLRQIQLQVGTAARAELDKDVIVLPSWWRLIGSMNDSDKASLKRLSTAFIRRFVFVPVDLPNAAEYERLIRDLAARHRGSEAFTAFVESLVRLFTRAREGFPGIGLPLGPSFPIDMMRQAEHEWAVDPGRSLSAVTVSTLEGVVEGQLQGRTDLYEAAVRMLKPFAGERASDLEARLAAWTGAAGR